MSDLQALEKLEQLGALRLLVLLSEKERYVTELLRGRTNPEGITSQDSLRMCRWELGERGLGLIEEHMEKGPRPKTFLVITEKGRRVAKKIKEIEGILEET